MSTKVTAAQLKRYIRENRITQKKLAEELNVTPITVNRWISGKRAMSKPYQKQFKELLASSLVYPYPKTERIIEEAAKAVDLSLNELISEVLDYVSWNYHYFHSN